MFDVAAEIQGISHTGEDMVEFGPFRLDRSRRQLTKNGTPVPLGGRAFEILQVLIRHAPEVVSKATLFEQVWPNTFIEESTLRFHLWTLRKALGDREDSSRYISTASGRGYCFVAPLSRSPAVATAEPGDREPSGAAPAAERPKTNLPLRLTEIIGRERDLAELAEWLKSRRFVTVVGPGGIGKTRLAVELGWRVLEDFAAGIWLIDLAPLSDGDAVASAVATTLGVSVTPTEATVDAIIAALGKRRPLLIVDNCEHLAEAAGALIKTLLERAPGVSILVTSRRSLGLVAERVYGLDPLAVPTVGAVEIGGVAAVQLFVQRARAADRTFELLEHNSAGIGEICRQLDGLPLALEMAAARLRLLGVEGLRRGMNDRLKLLRGSLDGDARHASLHGMLEWSHSLLAPLEQKVFRRLSAFPTSFTLEAAVALVGANEAERWLVVDALGRLIDHSLVTFEQHEPARYRLLETLRLYATDNLLEAGEANATAERHARHFIEVFDEAERCYEETPDPQWFARYQPELDNLRVSLAWTLATSERRQLAIALVASSCTLLFRLSLLGEGRGYLDRIVPLLDENTPPATTALLLRHTASFREAARDSGALAYAERSALLYRDLHDERGLANALVTQALCIARQQQHAEAKSLLQEAEHLLAGGNSKKCRLRLMVIKGITSLHMNDISAAQRFYSEALELANEAESRIKPAVLSNLGVVEYILGNTDRAIELTHASLTSRSSFQLGGEATGVTYINLGAYLIAGGRFSEARAYLQKGLSYINGNFHNVPTSLQPFAVLAGVEGRLAEAAQLIGFVDAERARLEQRMEAGPRRLYDRLMQMLEAGLPLTELDAWKARGASWTVDEAIEFVANRLMQAPASDDLAVVTKHLGSGSFSSHPA